MVTQRPSRKNNANEKDQEAFLSLWLSVVTDHLKALRTTKKLISLNEFKKLKEEHKQLTSRLKAVRLSLYVKRNTQDFNTTDACRFYDVVSLATYRKNLARRAYRLQ